MYNEQECAERSVRKLVAALDDMGLAVPIVVVDDGSGDDTNAILTRIQPEFGERLVVLSHPVNRGYGGAIKTAYEYAAEQDIEYVLFMDADLTQDPKYIADFIPLMEKGYGMIKASRYIAGGRAVNVPFFPGGHLICRQQDMQDSIRPAPERLHQRLSRGARRPGPQDGPHLQRL